MMRPTRRQDGFTLAELLIAAGVFGLVTIGLLVFTSTAMRLIGRNLSTNHSHDNVRISSQRMLEELHNAGSRFVLVDFDGTNYADATYSASSDTDPLTGKKISTRANGVRYYRLGGGPFRLTAATTPTHTDLQFNFGDLSYIPQAGDRISLPLLAKDFRIASIISAPGAGNPVGRIRIESPLGYTIKIGSDTVNGQPVTYNTTAYFYRKAAFTVYNQELRYHENFEGSKRASYTVVRRDVTSPKPFAVLYDGIASGTSSQLNLRMSLETTDLQYSAQRFLSSTTTLQAVVPPRNVPAQVTGTN